MNFNHLHYFHVTATAGSVKAAAERLGVTQPTISQQIRALEQSLGVQLFDRSAASLRLTRAGRVALEHTRAMFLEGDRLAAALRLTERGADEPVALRVGVSAAVARTIAVDLLMPLLAVERCVPEVHTSDLQELLRELRAHDLDLVVGEGAPTAEGFEVTPLHRPVLVAVVASSVSPAADWSDLQLLEFAPTSSYRWEVAQHLAANGLRPTPAGSFDDANILFEAATRAPLEGKRAFVAFVPRTTARAGVAAGRARVVGSLVPEGGLNAIHLAASALDVARVAVRALAEHSRSLDVAPS